MTLQAEMAIKKTWVKRRGPYVQRKGEGRGVGDIKQVTMGVPGEPVQTVPQSPQVRAQVLRVD